MNPLDLLLSFASDDAEEDDIIFILDTYNQVSAHRRPLGGLFTSVNIDASILLNKVCHARYLIAATVCCINKISKIVITQRCLSRCYASPAIPLPDVYFATLDVLDKITLTPTESLLCMEIILVKSKSIFEDIQVGDTYKSIRDLGKSVFEGSIEYSDIIRTFQPLHLRKEITLRGPWGRGTVHLNASRPRYSLKELTDSKYRNAPISIEICKTEMEWNCAKKLFPNNKS